MLSKKRFLSLGELNLRKNAKFIPVFFAPDDNYALMCLVSMVSIVENTDSKVEFVILYSNLSEKSFQILNTIRKYPNCKLTYKFINEKVFDGFKNSSWVTIQAWFRVLIPELYPKFDKVIYLDCDTMLRGDIADFWNIDVANNLIAAINECRNEPNAQRLKLKSNSYFNSGVLLINSKKWREIRLFDKIEDCAKNNELILFGDQDVLNVVIDEDKIIVPQSTIFIEVWWWKDTYKKLCETEEFIKTRNNSLIVHFTSEKPYSPKCRHSLRGEWWNYAKKTPFYIEILEKFKTEADLYIDELTNK